MTTFALVTVGLAALHAQTINPHPTVTATGQATVSATPDQVKIDLGVTTQGSSAQDAASKNATQVATLVSALQNLLGQGADIKTVNYYVAPVYKNDGSSTIIGYTASLTTEVTLGAISLAGSVIDTAASNGATTIGLLQFSLKDPDPTRLQALKLATMQAKSHADAMAAGAGHTTGDIISLQENTTSIVVPIGIAGPGGSSTQITPGLIQVTATVILQALLL